MFYNKDNPQWTFNEEQFLSNDEYYRMVDEYDALTREMLRTDFRDINEKFYGIKEKYSSEEEREYKRKRQLIFGIGAAAFFAGLILTLILKQLVIFGYLACAIFLAVGISVLITGKGEVIESSSKAIFNRIIALGMILASAGILLLMIFRTKFAEAEFFILIFVLVFGIAGLGLLAITIMRLLSGKLIYTAEADATCIGYVRYVNRESGENHNRFTFINTSPLFKYSYEGVQYEAVYDEFISKKDSDISMGQTVPLKIDPKHPENIKSPVMTNAGGIGLMIFMSLALLAAGIGMCIYVLAGSAKDMTVETQWNSAVNKINGDEPTETTMLQISDEMIEEAYADLLKGKNGWYIETKTVASRTSTSDGFELTFDDDSFGKALADDKAPEVGSEIILFYYVDEDRVADGVAYKKVFSFGSPDTFEYTGSHKAYNG